MGKLDGRIAIVTGASRGLGEEIAKLFAWEGASVVCAARTLNEGDHRLLSGSLSGTVRQIEAAGYPVEGFVRLDAAGGFITPGLIDAHTHLVFAGTREAEWQMRAGGAGYLEVLAAGGGILATVAATRAASDEQLLIGGRLAAMLANGTTTVEAKSGYALDTAGELRLLELTRQLGSEGPVQVVPTFLGAHAVPAEYRNRHDGTAAYVSSVIDEQLPAVARQRIAQFCDVFCERGVFDAQQSRRILLAARELGLAIRLHADELEPSGGAELAAEIGCCSADHLAAPSDAGIEAMARAAGASTPVVATLLPATSWFLGKHHFAPARRLIDAGIPVALATDLNPGTSPTLSLPLVMSIACMELGLTPAETLTAVTINAAHSLGLGGRIGSIEPGKQADLVLWDVPTLEQIPYWLGDAPVRTVIKRGRTVFERAR